MGTQGKRNALLALVALALTTSAAPAQNPEWANKLFPEGTTHNFGNVPRGAVLPYKFKMTNIYAVPLQIINTRASCGCVTIKPSADVIQPKESATIEISMDARRFTGPKTVDIFITVGPQFTSTATLHVSANSRADVVFNPGAANFGVVASGQSPTLLIDIEYAGALDWKVTGIADHQFPLTTKVEELYRQPGPIVKVGYRLNVTVKADAPPGTHRCELLVQTNDPASPSLPVLAEFTVQAPLSVAPSPLTLGSLKVGEEVSRRVVVRGSKPFRILSIEGQDDGLSVEFPGQPALVHVVTVKWVPMQVGDLKRDLKFQTDLDGGASATVAVEGKVAQ